jgi:GNAT superfamily N-acetyltransferase
MSALRIITTADIPAAMQLKDTAGWNQTEQDWRNVMHLAPEGCFGIEADGMLAATTTAVCFGSKLAWIGMVLTHPEYRGRGFARALMEHALDWLDGRAEWIKLDATDMGRPLYAKLGFEDECPIERWLRPAGGPLQAIPPESGRPLDFNLDRAAFGADRGALLQLLAAGESISTPAGYAMGRPGTRADYFGPCVASAPQAAAELARWYVARHAQAPIFWDILPTNGAAVEIARELGFEPVRKLVRMAKPGRTPFRHEDSSIYAIAGLEFG